MHKIIKEKTVVPVISFNDLTEQLLHDKIIVYKRSGSNNIAKLVKLKNGYGFVTLTGSIETSPTSFNHYDFLACIKQAINSGKNVFILNSLEELFKKQQTIINNA